MYRVLLVYDDPTAGEVLRQHLEPSGYALQGARTGRDAVMVVRSLQPAVALISVELPDMPGFEVLRGVRRDSPGTACILVGEPSTRMAVAAMRFGAHGYIDTPLDGVQVLDALRSAMADPPLAADGELELHATARWAQLVLSTIDAPSDPNSLYRWSRAVGVSIGALRNWCRTARHSSRRSLLFARMLRAVLRQSVGHTAPEDLLNVVDRRTLAKLLLAGGGTETQLPATVDEFLRRQAFIVDDVAVNQIRSALARRYGPGLSRSA
jgi:CheY-like chemotaxis protein